MRQVDSYGAATHCEVKTVQFVFLVSGKVKQVCDFNQQR